MAFVDDVVVFNTSVDERNIHLGEVFSCVQSHVFYRHMKQHIYLSSPTLISYPGTVINKNDQRTDPNKTATVQNFHAVSNKVTIQSFSGMINQYNNFIPNMQSLRASLGNSLTKDTRCFWWLEYHNVFQKIENILMSGLALRHFNPQLSIIAAAGASDYWNRMVFE